MGIIDKDADWQPPDFSPEEGENQFGDIKPVEKSPYDNTEVNNSASVLSTASDKTSFQVEEFKAPDSRQVDQALIKDTIKPADDDFKSSSIVSEPRNKDYQRLDFSHDDVNRRTNQQMSMATAGAAVAREANRDYSQFAPPGFNPNGYGGFPNNQHMPMSGMYNSAAYPNNMMQNNMGNNPYNLPSWSNSGGGYSQGTVMYMTKNGKLLESVKIFWFSVTLSAIIFVWLSIYLFVMVGQLMFDRTITIPPELTSDLSNLVTFIIGGVLALVTENKPSMSMAPKKENDPSQQPVNKEIEA
jgi:hypothetical protein